MRGQVALVTGAGSAEGIGFAIARRLHVAGARVVVTSTTDRIHERARELDPSENEVLAFVADLCIATEDARFTPAYGKLGVSPDGGGTVGVAASVGARRALQIFLAEDSFSAAQAFTWGLVAKVVPAVERKAATRELAHRLAQNAPAAIAATKALVHRAPTMPIEQQLDAERDAIIDCMHTGEFRIAVKKFTSKGK